jgi:hypothetical protein
MSMRCTIQAPCIFPEELSISELSENESAKGQHRNKYLKRI